MRLIRLIRPAGFVVRVGMFLFSEVRQRLSRKMPPHLIFLVSGGALPVEAESLPFHILGRQETKEREIAQLLIGEPRLLEQFGEWAVSLHPSLGRELSAMARTKGLKLDVKPLADLIGVEEIIRQLGPEEVGEKLLHVLTPVQRRKLRKRLQDEEGDQRGVAASEG
jgi:hypothetical protein